MTTSQKINVDAHSLLTLYGQYWKEKKYHKALKIIDILLSHYPDNMALFWYHCCALEKLNMHNQAVSEIHERYRSGKEDIVETLKLDDFELFTITLQDMPADICQKMIAAFNDEKKVLALFSHLIALNPNAIKWYIQRAKYYYYSSLYGNKINGLSDVVQNPYDINHSQCRLENVLLDYQKVIELVPDRTESYISLAKVLHLLHRYDDALDVYDRVLQLKPDDYSFKETVLELRKISENRRQSKYHQMIHLTEDSEKKAGKKNRTAKDDIAYSMAKIMEDAVRSGLSTEEANEIISDSPDDKTALYIAKKILNVANEPSIKLSSASLKDFPAYHRKHIQKVEKQAKKAGYYLLDYAESENLSKMLGQHIVLGLFISADAQSCMSAYTLKPKWPGLLGFLFMFLSRK